MREIRTSGSVGDPGGRPPGSTRCAPGQAWRRGTEDVDGSQQQPETFIGDPAGPNPARQRLATSRKRVLRGGPAMATAKRRQRPGKPRNLSPESPVAWAVEVRGVGGSIPTPYWRGVGARPGCWPEANLERGSPGTWEIRSSPIENRRLGLRLTQAPRARRQGVLTLREPNHWAHDGIAKRRKRSAARWVAGSQSVS